MINRIPFSPAMPEPFLIAVSTLTNQPNLPDQTVLEASREAQRRQQIQAEKERLDRLLLQLRRNVTPETQKPSGEFTSEVAPKQSTSLNPQPRSGSQLYAQRVAATKNRQLHSRLPVHSFQTTWSQSRNQPTYQQWRKLLAQEASVAKSKASNVGVLLGDSLSLWFPNSHLPETRSWLNQSISGDTTKGILRRLDDFSQTRPRVVYIMAGVNDLKNGATDSEILSNLRQIVYRLRQTQPQAKVVMQSILPTRSLPVAPERIQHLNQRLKTIANQQGAYYLDVYSSMVDTEGYLRANFTTDGLHLNSNGYQAWRSILQQAEWQIAYGE